MHNVPMILKVFFFSLCVICEWCVHSQFNRSNYSQRQPLSF